LALQKAPLAPWGRFLRGAALRTKARGEHPRRVPVAASEPAGDTGYVRPPGHLQRAGLCL